MLKLKGKKKDIQNVFLFFFSPVEICKRKHVFLLNVLYASTLL